jgi:hypothetical protein
MEGAMTNTEKNQLIADVARDIIEQTEPAELPLFRAISREYFKRPAEARKNQSGGDEMLGLGIGEAVSLLTLRAALVGVLIYCTLILCITIGWCFITRQPATSHQLISIGSTLLILFQVLVGAIVAGRSRQRGWLYGLFAAFITGLLGSASRLLATDSTITSFAQDRVTILESTLTAATGILIALPVTLIVYFAVWSIRRLQLRKAIGPSATTTPTSS